jgi:hypothetical protein
MDYLNLTTSSINEFYNTITREGKDQIYFDDVVQVIGYLEESKFKEKKEEIQENGLNLNLLEIENIIANFKDLKNIESVNELEEQLNGIFLMFVVDFEAKNGRGSAPDLFKNVNFDVLFEMLSKYPLQLESSLISKLEEKKLKEATGRITVNFDPKNFVEGGFYKNFNLTEKSRNSISIMSLSEALKTENNSLLNQINWTKPGPIRRIQELSEKFEKQKLKLNILSVKGLEKTAFLNKKSEKGKGEKKKIKTITKVQSYMKECISNVEKLFKESLELLKISKLKEEELKQKMVSKDNQIKFWENANEEIESRLNEINLEKIELKKELKEIKNNKLKTEKMLKKREDEIILREKELRQREDEIDMLRSDMRQSNVNLRLMEDQKSMAEEMKVFTQEELKKIEEESKFNEINSKKMMQKLQNKNLELKKELDYMTKSNKDLENEMFQLMQKYEQILEWSRIRRFIPNC